MDSTEAELENFRQRWREEVTAKTRSKTSAPASSSKSTEASSSKGPSKSNAPEIPTHARHKSLEEDEGIDPHAHRDYGEVQPGRRLDDEGSASVGSSKEPRSALEHYEKAVEKETQGSLGDSVNLYRKAFRLDENVHQKYKNKYFPPSAFPPKPQIKSQDPNPSNASSPSPANPAHHSLKGLSPTFQSLIQGFSQSSIQGEPPPTDLSPPPPCPIVTIPEELLVEILEYVAVQDLASYVRLAQVCKRLAYLIITEDRIWKRICLGPEFGFAAMHYSWACKLDGKPLGDDGDGGHILGNDGDDDLVDELEALQLSPKKVDPVTATQLLVPTPYPRYLSLFRLRPRLRFNGCYISTVNYTRPGASSPTSVSWNSPIHIVTYYRYLRFLRDGRVIALLTTAEPSDVVPYLWPENVRKDHAGSLPQSVMRDALWGRWRLSGPATPPTSKSSASEEGDKTEDAEPEGTLHIETEGVTPKYVYKMAFSLVSAGRGAKNNKLVWQGYWSYNRLTDDWAEFGLKNDRAFYWSRVKSYGMGL
ncbi:hypothetical protein GQ43DRAFT_463552 [Delitschia confertaspora ATCC 74209]|uniref:F-box domain-containing protein n=1 Tax=Delitschia confertaspora ATCC 74209 TaxID=1513339 RepID=A0A9P4MPQ4_9PLEO|nr:hypothetical protein GQ43DRAFT_463552 [Delitschia confertaspora ATCC 74209]